MSKSSILTTFAILLANFDDGGDYLSNFEPFVIDRLKELPPEVEARPKRLCKELSEAYHLPRIPINTVTELRDRAFRTGFLVTGSGGRLYPNREALDRVASLGSDRTELLDHFDQLVGEIRRYARESANCPGWTLEQAEAALECFLEEFSIEMAMAKRAGEVDGDPEVSRNEALAVVHGFARHALELDGTSLQYLEEVVRGSLLANVVYVQDLGAWTPKLGSLVAYLDTTVAFRVLELTDGEVSEASRQLIDLLRQFDVPVRIFDHTLAEMQGVLERVQKDLRSINMNGKADLDDIDLRGQEVLAHALRQKWGPADIEEAFVNLKRRLAEQGIAVAAAPKPDSKLTLDEARLDERLRDLSFSVNQRTKDIQSLNAVHILREGRSYSELGEARAIFVTSNDRLVKAANEWFSGQGVRSTIPQCTSETSFTTQLWLRKPEKRPNVARKFLIAESFAALNPSPELWNRYLDRIAQRRQRDEISDEQVKTLVFSTAAKAGLVEVTHGEPERIDDETVAEVLARSGDGIIPDLAEQLEQARQNIQVLRLENDTVRNDLTKSSRTVQDQGDMLATQGRDLAALHKEIDDLKRANERRAGAEAEAGKNRARLRRITGVAAAVAVVGATLAIWFGHGVADPVVRAGIGFGGANLATIAIALGFGKRSKWVLKTIAFWGAFLALFFGLIAVAGNGSGKSGTEPPSAHGRP